MDLFLKMKRFLLTTYWFNVEFIFEMGILFQMELEMSSGSESVTPTGRGSPVMSGSTPQKSNSKSATASATAAGAK